MESAGLSGFYERTRAARKVIMVDFGFLGDALHLVPALWEIRRHYPGAELHVLTSPLGAEALRLAPCVDRVWHVELHPERRRLREQLAAILAVRREKFDVAFSFSGSDRATIFTGLTGARQRVGRLGGRKHFWNRWLIKNWSPAQDPALTVWERHRQSLAACGFTLQPPRFDLRVDENSVKWAEPLVPRGAVHVSLNSANPLKEWPLEHYTEMLRAIWQAEPQLPVVVSASASEREQERLRKFTALASDGRLLTLPGKPGIAQLAAVVQRCRLHVGPDSGVVHLAVALGVPTISFFREQGGYKCWLPSGPQHRVFTVPCVCIDHHFGTCEAAGQADCLAKIQPAQVAAVVLSRPMTGASTAPR
jgi:ADP-heptose:LPS heptosyltransferase